MKPPLFGRSPVRLLLAAGFFVSIGVFVWMRCVGALFPATNPRSAKLVVARVEPQATPFAQPAVLTVTPEEVARSNNGSKHGDWLKSSAPAAATPAPTPVVITKRFADARVLVLRPVEAASMENEVSQNPPAEKKIVETPVALPRAAWVHVAEPAPEKVHVAERSVAATPAPAPRAPKASTPEAHPKIAHATASPTPAPSTPAARVAEKQATPPHRAPGLTADARMTDMRATSGHTPAPQPLKSVANVAPLAPPMRPVNVTSVAGRYPWKANIVTTVFWIGEPMSGNNFTPNVASSWDPIWTRNYGGYDNPHPEARHNFIPVNFVPRQNPFYVALPYNDVTRGTTKPEARVVIPWFKDAFRKEGQSVCRDRWVAVRNRAGRVAFAQWSDCGPFRTDHWQYVFGMERPKPNLNQGAGLDVSPAMRDYLGLQSTDVTDWKFVEARDVPQGPWSLYGDNNTFVQRARFIHGSAKTGLQMLPEVAARTR